MKILESNVTYLSESHQDKMDLSLEYKKEEKTESRARRSNQTMQNNPNQIRSGLLRAGWLGNPEEIPQVIVDRVSIQQNQHTEYQANYSANVSSQSTVLDQAKNETHEYSQQYAMEKVVGGLIDRELVIRKMEQGEDIQLSALNSDKDPMAVGQRNSLPNQTQSRNQLTQSWQMSIHQTDIHFETEDVDFSAKGKVTTEDGRTIQFSLGMSLDRAFVSQTQKQTLINRWKEQINLTDPLVVSLDGKAPALSDARFEFDLNSDGETESINFVNQGSGFLAFDKNNDQVINNGSELFGPGTGNGFEELSQFDTDGNNWIDENDEVFTKLSVWTKNAAGEDKLISLSEAGIGAINLEYAATRFNMADSDNTLNGQLKSTGMFLFENGNVGALHQLDLVSHEKEDDLMSIPLDRQSLAGARNLLGLGIDPTGINRFEQPDTQTVRNPIQDLLDRIEKLKQEMSLLFEKTGPALPKNPRRHQRQSRYMGFNPDPPQLLFWGRGNRRRGRYI